MWRRRPLWAGPASTWAASLQRCVLQGRARCLCWCVCGGGGGGGTLDQLTCTDFYWCQSPDVWIPVAVAMWQCLLRHMDVLCLYDHSKIVRLSQFTGGRWWGRCRGHLFPMPFSPPTPHPIYQAVHHSHTARLEAVTLPSPSMGNFSIQLWFR